MTPATAKAQYARAIAKVGEQVQFQRNVAVPPATANWQAYATARCRPVDYDFRPTPLVGSLAQDERMLIVLPYGTDGVVYAKPQKNHRAIVRGVECTIMEVDDSTRRIAGTLLAYEVRVKG